MSFTGPELYGFAALPVGYTTGGGMAPVFTSSGVSPNAIHLIRGVVRSEVRDEGVGRAVSGAGEKGREHSRSKDRV